jgi:anti-anti-sigma factor
MGIWILIRASDFSCLAERTCGQRNRSYGLTLRIRSSLEGRSLILWAQGELDFDSKQLVLDAVNAAPDGIASIVIDMTELAFIDSQDLSALVMCYQASQVAGRSFLIRGATGRVARSLEDSGRYAGAGRSPRSQSDRPPSRDALHRAVYCIRRLGRVHGRPGHQWRPLFDPTLGPHGYPIDSLPAGWLPALIVSVGASLGALAVAAYGMVGAMRGALIKATALVDIVIDLDVRR